MVVNKKPSELGSYGGLDLLDRLCSYMVYEHTLWVVSNSRTGSHLGVRMSQELMCEFV